MLAITHCWSTLLSVRPPVPRSRCRLESLARWCSTVRRDSIRRQPLGKWSSCRSTELPENPLGLASLIWSPARATMSTRAGSVRVAAKSPQSDVLSVRTAISIYPLRLRARIECV
ncbi:hypothetical protein [Lysobacter gummosus]|uniref:hypothetical protein n=1 Tax=Lysobacter gummosus TaxID=262324 RepID=UPI003645780D